MTLAQLTQAFQALAPYSKNYDVEQEILFAMLGWAQPEGIMTGTNANAMSPDLGVTRAQVATMLMQFHRSYGGLSSLSRSRNPNRSRGRSLAREATHSPTRHPAAGMLAENEKGPTMRIVIKVGTSTLAHPTGRLNIQRIELYARL